MNRGRFAHHAFELHWGGLASFVRSFADSLSFCFFAELSDDRRHKML